MTSRFLPLVGNIHPASQTSLPGLISLEFENLNSSSFLGTAKIKAYVTVSAVRGSSSLSVSSYVARQPQWRMERNLFFKVLGSF